MTLLLAWGCSQLSSREASGGSAQVYTEAFRAKTLISAQSVDILATNFSMLWFFNLKSINFSTSRSDLEFFSSICMHQNSVSGYWIPQAWANIPCNLLTTKNRAKGPRGGIPGERSSAWGSQDRRASGCTATPRSEPLHLPALHALYQNNWENNLSIEGQLKT